jgi:hypothetical protein
MTYDSNLPRQHEAIEILPEQREPLGIELIQAPGSRGLVHHQPGFLQDPEVLGDVKVVCRRSHSDRQSGMGNRELGMTASAV